ncbi:hypothetical protein RI103_38100 (plasmid) [Paraburkholderia sp. FT54]|uniref:hypothetical protein n=1 Tax=Paraburkholderia sp. FT54 TaxID=3074437 RepID=UPI002877B795|nr:hypothetical protein [Paraburkholderia sp. FT54]WNC95500.1 hypothetical protein RI103_38100 [Paraburkholderia sp. FT54]
MPSIRSAYAVSRLFSRTALAFTALCFAAGGADAQSAAKPLVTPGFSLTVFAVGSGGLISAPDSLAVLDGHVWVGYANNGAPDGSNGAMSVIVEYSQDGSIVKTYQVAGHNDGLKVNPYTREIWAMQNEDANPNLVIINPATGQASKPYSFGKTLHGGGYDDIVFKDGQTYFSASNPTLNSSGKNMGPAIVRVVHLDANTYTIDVAPVMRGTLDASNIPFGTVATLTLPDPDSMTLTPSGDVLLDDQGDGQLVLLRSSGDDLNVQYLPLLGNVQVDDTVFATARRGYLLVSDTKANIVYKISANVWQRDAAFSASTGVAATSSTPAVPAYVGQLDLHSGALLPLVTNLGQSAWHGLCTGRRPAVTAAH